MKKNSNVGGQAVIEGVMMKNGPRVAIAVRRPDNKITVKKIRMKSIADKITFLKWPFIRGTVNLVEQLIVGIKALNYSANEAIGEEEESINTWEFTITTIISILVAIGVFVLLPLYLTKITRTEGILFNIIDGIIRIIFFVAYIAAISLMKDVKRLFQYHGAEHKTVNCYESGKKLTVKNVKKFSTAHKRCGTTFLLIVLIISIAVFSFIVSDNFWIKFGARIILLPVVAGIGYELLKIGAKYDNWLTKMIIWPGMLIQSMTTREPDNKQIEVAIKSFKTVVKEC